MSEPSLPFSADLLRHRQMMLGLARELVGSSEAEDVVQDAWVQALRRPPGTNENLGGWLLRITRNLAFNRGRARLRRREHERGAARAEDAEDESEHLHERFELTLQVAESVRALAEPYRTVVLLRYFENRSHEEIARHLERPLPTVRTQLRRGLEQLRERMDRECGGRKVWTAGLIVWLESQRALPIPEPTVSAPLLATAALASLVLVAGGAWYWLAPPRGVPAPAVAPAPASTPAIVGSDEPAASLRDALDSRTSESVLEVGSGWRVEGRVIGPRMDPVRVKAEPVWRAYSVEVAALESTTDAEGRFALDLSPLVHELPVNAPAPDAFDLLLDHPQRLPERVRLWAGDATLEADGSRLFHVELSLRPAAAMAGIVLAPDGSPLSGAFVLPFAVEAGGPSAPAAEPVYTDFAGRYRLRVAEEADYLVAIATGGLRPATVALHPSVGQELLVAETWLEAGERLAGFALQLSQPLDGAEVELRVQQGRRLPVQFPGATPALAWLDGRFEWASPRAVANEAGEFFCSGLAPNRYAAAIVSVSGVDVTLPRPQSVNVEVRAPAEGVELSLAEALIELELRASRAETCRLDLRGGHGVLSAPVRVPGTLRILAPATTELSLEAVLPSGAVGRLDLWTPPAGERTLQVLECRDSGAGSAVELHVKAAAGAEGLRLWLAVQAEGSESDAARFTRFVDLRGPVARIDGLPSGAHRLVLREGRDPQGVSFYPTISRSLELAPGETHVLEVEFVLAGQIQVDVRWRDGQRGAVSFRLHDARGEPVDARFEAFVSDERTSSRTSLISWAENRLVEPLPPGLYELATWTEGREEQRVPVRVEAGKEMRVELVF